MAQPGAHSSLNNYEDFEDILPVDKLAMKTFQQSQVHKLHEEASKEEEEEGGI
jgi:hypothetical protein